MAESYQPKFSRASLNVLMIVSTVLIVIFGQTARKAEKTDFPTAPKFPVSAWQTDSGAKIWYSPYLTDGLEIQLWYDAGYRYDTEHQGLAFMLASLIRQEAKARELPISVSLDPDFLKVGIILSTDPVAMKRQIDQLQSLLRRPTLDHKILAQLRTANTRLSQALIQQLYGQHPYAGPDNGVETQRDSVTRADVQKFHQQFMHPQRLHGAIVGDINQHTAQIIMESLLPPSRHPHEAVGQLSSMPWHSSGHSHQTAYALPGFGQDNQDHKTPSAQHAVDLAMTEAILKQVGDVQIQLIPGMVNSTLLINADAATLQTMKSAVDSDMIALAQRHLISQWLTQVNQSSGLCLWLAMSNAYGYGEHELQLWFDQAAKWDEDQWQTVADTWLATPTQL